MSLSYDRFHMLHVKLYVIFSSPILILLPHFTSEVLECSLTPAFCLYLLTGN